MVFPESWFEDEVRDGFYVPAIMKRAWAAELEVLEQVATICEKHGIRWFADSGTLLGAVRHGGFIPWDDDMDIVMFREDYNRFITVAPKELPQGYQAWIKDKEDWYTHIKIFSSQNMCGDVDYLEKHHGFPFLVWVDIFPLDYMAADTEDEKIRDCLGKIVWGAAETLNEENRNTEGSRQLIEKIEKLLNIRLDQTLPLKEQLYALREQIFSMYPREGAWEVACMSYWLREGIFRYPLHCFERQVMFPFEMTSLPAPNGYDEELSLMFGDYMSFCRSGDFHQYPFYQAVLDAVEKEGVSLYGSLNGYRFCRKHLEKERETTLLEDFINTARRTHDEILDSIMEGYFDTATTLLATCQSTAISVGTALEQKGNPITTIQLLEEYCECVWRLHEAVLAFSSGKRDTDDKGPEAKDIESLLDRMETHANDVRKARKEVVFLPFRASAWERFEPTWRKFHSDSEYDVSVIPIPYYYKKWDGSTGQMHFDADQYPDYVPITDYHSYDFKNRQPKIIFIQNPYDEWNLTTSVPPFFYASNLKRFTDHLIYIPYFVLDESEPDDPKAAAHKKYYIAMPGVMQSDLVVVQSERMRMDYIDFLTEFAGEDTRAIWEGKIISQAPDMPGMYT